MRTRNPLKKLIFIGCLWVQGALAQSAAELFAEGNNLVRSGVFRTALLRYREAAAAGFDTPLLHYNLGVVNYKLGEFKDAAAEFALAAADPTLAALASYNRGLAERAAGDRAAATQSFQVAAERADDRDLRRLAEGAVQGRASVSARPEPRRSSGRRTPAAELGAPGDLVLVVDARMGQDDNIYRTPANPYVDLANPTLPLITPEPQSASFVPLELTAAYLLKNESGDTDFEFRYDLDGDFYGGELSNATVADQRVSMGADIVLGERERHRRTLDTAFFVRSHDETNFDPDDGLARDVTVAVNGVPTSEDVSDRFSYQASGVEGEFAQELGRWGWALDLRFERREYATTELVANFDHEYFSAGVDIDYELSTVMMLRAGLRQYRRGYDDRRARDLTGALFQANPAQEYSYQSLRLGMRRELSRAIVLEADYWRIVREDGFVGYEDYTQDALRLRARLRPTAQFDITLGGVARAYDYPRAFAFNVVAGGPRELDELGAELEAEFRFTEHLAFWAALSTLDVTSSDARAQYARTRAMLGIEWRR